jgi:D-alanyl-D-alanine carboxypeptidase
MGGRLADLSPDLIPFAQDLLDAAGAAGLQPRITSTVRTHSEQRRLYSSYLANPGRAYPVAPPGYSAHEYGEAFDMVVSPMEALADVGYTWQQWGGGWNPRDAVHFELPGASERARQAGSQLEPDTGIIGSIVDWYTGSTLAALLRLLPGLSESEGLKLLANPSQLPTWIIEQLSLPTLRR